MAGFIARQPNGLICRFSTVMDTVTHYNMTEEEYIEMRAEIARQEARDTINNYMKPFDMVKERFCPNNMTQERFNEILSEMEKPTWKTTMKVT